MPVYSCSDANHPSKPAFLVVTCSRAGKPRQTKKLTPGHKQRKRTSLKCGCTWYVRFTREPNCDEWTVVVSFLIHKPPCNPSASQVAVIQKRRGQQVSEQILEQLRDRMDFTTAQIRTWINKRNLPLRTDAMSIHNLLMRVKWYDLVSHKSAYVCICHDVCQYVCMCMCE